MKKILMINAIFLPGELGAIYLANPGIDFTLPHMAAVIGVLFLANCFILGLSGT